MGDRNGSAATLDSLGYACHKLGHHARAIEYCQRAAELFRNSGSRYSEAEALQHLGEAHDARGDLAAAQRAWSRASDLLGQLGHPAR